MLPRSVVSAPAEASRRYRRRVTDSDVDLSSLGRLLGDGTRATMLTALLAGRALTAGELARLAGVGAPAASAHLARLVEGGVVSVARQGRHRYFRLAGPEVAAAIEAVAAVSPLAVRSLRMSRAAAALRPARLCYDHLAGRLGVHVHDHLVGAGAFAVALDGLALTPAGRAWFDGAGVDVEAAARARRPLLRPCLDWTERRPHLAGSLAAGLAARWLELGWLERRSAGERGLRVSPVGARALADLVALDVGTLTYDRAAADEAARPAADRLPAVRATEASRVRRERSDGTDDFRRAVPSNGRPANATSPKEPSHAHA